MQLLINTKCYIIIVIIIKQLFSSCHEFYFGNRVCTFLTKFTVLINYSVLVTDVNLVSTFLIRNTQNLSMELFQVFICIKCVLLCCGLFFYVQTIKCIHCFMAVNDTFVVVHGFSDSQRCVLNYRLSMSCVSTNVFLSCYLFWTFCIRLYCPMRNLFF